MNQENSEFEISGIQLRESRTQPRVSMSMEIGEAEIVHTIFGKAKVRIIRKQHKMRRALWWAGLAGAAAIVAVSWQQGWLGPQPAEPLQSADALLASPVAPSSATAASADGGLSVAASSVGGLTNAPAEPVFQTLPQKLIAQQANEIRAAEKAAAMPAREQDKPVPVRQQPAARPAPVLAQSAPVAASAVVAKPRLVAPQPGMASAPSVVPLAGNAMKSPVDALPQKPKPAAPASAVAATHVAQPASGPAAAVPLAAPISVRENAPQLPTGDKPLSDPVNTSGK